MVGYDRVSASPRPVPVWHTSKILGGYGTSTGASERQNGAKVDNMLVCIADSA